METTQTGHTPITGCGCHLVPVNDDWQACDLCSEATQGPAGIGWKIEQCPLHKAAPDLLEALKELLDCPAMNEDTAEPATVTAYDKAIAAIDKARATGQKGE